MSSAISALSDIVHQQHANTSRHCNMSLCLYRFESNCAALKFSFPDPRSKISPKLMGESYIMDLAPVPWNRQCSLLCRIVGTTLPHILKHIANLCSGSPNPRCFSRVAILDLGSLIRHIDVRHVSMWVSAFAVKFRGFRGLRFGIWVFIQDF